MKTKIRNTTIGTQIIVVQVTDNAVIFLSIPYGKRNMFVLVIGRIELMTITENHAVDMTASPSNEPNSMRVMSGVSTTVKNMIQVVKL